MPKENVNQVLHLLLRTLKISVTHQTVEDEIAKHPEAKSLLAINELLTYWNVPNAAYNLSFDELEAVPVPFIACFAENEFVLVTTFDKKNAIISNQRWNNHVIGLKKFKQSYAGSVLIAEKAEDSGEADYSKKRRRELLNRWRMPFVYAGMALLFLTLLLKDSAYISTLNLQIILLTLFKLAGVVTGVLLLIQSIDANNPIITKLCSGSNDKDCNAILSSSAAKITDELSWSEVGFFYFTGTWLVLLFNSNQPNVLQVLAVLNILSLPYTFYSIYYQWRVAKQWCVFCCAVQTLLWLEFFAFLPSILHGIHNPDGKGWTGLFTGMALPVLVWVLMKPHLLKSKQIVSLKHQLREFKYNATLFNKLLNGEQQHTLPTEEHSIIIGNREAEQVITVVSNPYCQPCSRAHKTLDKWLESREDIKLQVIFATNDTDDPRAQVAGHLMALQLAKDDFSLKKAMSDWYEHKQNTYEAWSAVHAVKKEINHSHSLAAQREWCKKAEIMGTPTIFINGRKLPQNYQLEDIRYFI